MRLPEGHKVHLRGNLEVRRVYLHTHPWAFSALCSLANSLPTTARSLAKAKLLQGWSGSRSWGFKGITAHEWAPLGMWDTPSLSQGLQSCHSTQVLLQKTNLPGKCSLLGTKTEPLLSFVGLLAVLGGPSSPWSQLLMPLQITVQLGSFWGRECKNPSYSVWGMCGRPEESAPGMPSQGTQQEKRTLEKLDFHAGHPVWWIE